MRSAEAMVAQFQRWRKDFLVTDQGRYFNPTDVLLCELIEEMWALRAQLAAYHNDHRHWKFGG